MSFVVTETRVETAMPAGQPGHEEWKAMGFYLENLQTFYQEAMIDVVKVTNRVGKLKSVPIPSIADSTWRAKDALQKDPCNLKLITKLGYLFCKEGQHDQCLNVMMRGWKRVGEIPDAEVRFRFLMKLAELSMGFWKYRQGLAIWRDIEEPAEPRQLKSYLVLGLQLWCNNGDLQQSLGLFQRCIDQEPYEHALRILAVVGLDLKKAGGYEVAKGTMEQWQPNPQDPELRTLDACLQQLEERKKVLSPDQAKRRYFYVLAGLLSFFFLCILYYFESRSLAAVQSGKP